MTANPSFEYVSHQLLLEEPEPTAEALKRWQRLYPGYRDSLEEFFAAWTLTMTSPAELETEGPDSDENATVEKCRSYAMGVLGKQGRWIPKDTVELLQPFDQLVLVAVVEMEGAGYTGSITRKVRELSGNRVLLASVSRSLHRLESKRLVVWRHADPVTEPENEGRQYFMATMAGERALAHAKAAAREAADFLGDFA
jgi:hypothetical protein